METVLDTLPINIKIEKKTKELLIGKNMKQISRIKDRLAKFKKFIYPKTYNTNIVFPFLIFNLSIK